MLHTCPTRIDYISSPRQWKNKTSTNFSGVGISSLCFWKIHFQNKQCDFIQYSYSIHYSFRTWFRLLWSTVFVSTMLCKQALTFPLQCTILLLYLRDIFYKKWLNLKRRLSQRAWFYNHLLMRSSLWSLVEVIRWGAMGNTELCTCRISTHPYKQPVVTHCKGKH